MKWRSTSNRALVEAIVDTFRSSPEYARRVLSEFNPKDWARTEFWLDASGLALYFLDHVQSTGIEDAVDMFVIKRLQQKLADNKNRRAAMFDEFATLNLMFERAGVHYANLKGFTLSPDSCPNPVLRHQLDFDFLVSPEHLAVCRSLLEEKGYVLTATTRQTWEFKGGTLNVSSMKDHYKATSHLSVELHFTPDATDSVEIVRDPRLDRLGSWACPEGTFPALSAADQIVGQALHILGHLRGEGTRPSWLLEFRHHVLVNRTHKSFWREVGMLAKSHPNAATALGLSILLTTELFGSFSPPELNAWTLNTLPFGVKLWAERYGRDAVLADTPGTKLYLLLESELSRERKIQPQKSTMQRLIPLHRAPRVFRAGPHDSLRVRIYQEILQLRYDMFRLRFHATQGFLYAIEAARWKRLVKERSSVSLSTLTSTSLSQ
jgi:hypothetical protein